MKNIGQLMKQAQEMQGRVADMQTRLESTEIAGQSGAGMVTLVLSGKGDLKKVGIDPSLLNPDESEILEDLLIAAHSDAKAKLESHISDEMGKITGGMPLPPGFKLPF